MKSLFNKAVILINALIFLFASLLNAQTGSDAIKHNHEDIAPFAGSHRYNSILTNAMLLQNRIDSLENQAEGLRQEIMYMDNATERNRLQFHLGVLEEETAIMQAEADSLFNVLSLMKDFETEQNDLLILDTVIDGIKVYRYKQEESSRSDVTSSNNFTISKKSVYSSDHPFEQNFTVPMGVFYRIQMAAVSQPAGWDQFGGIQPVTVEPGEDGKLFKYYAGKFTVYSEADSALVKVRSAGFRDAFIIGYYNGKRMSTEQVREFEKSER